MTTLSEVQDFINKLSTDRDSYRKTVNTVRDLLGVKDVNVNTTVPLRKLLAEFEALKKAIANPPTTVPGAGGTVINNSFTGRMDFGPAWRVQFEEDFPMLVAMGAFLTKYGKWDAYPDWYYGTNQDPKKGGGGDHYSFAGLGVEKVDGETTALISRMFPAAMTSDGKNWSSAPYPRWTPTGTASAPTSGGQVRVRFPDTEPGAHWANLLWNDKKPWASGGESDIIEFVTPGKIGCFFHFDEAAVGDGGDQCHFTALDADPTQFNVIGWQQVAGKSFKWFVNGKQVKPDDHASLMKRGLADADGTIIARVPDEEMRLVLQNELEPGNKLRGPVEAQYDWITMYLPA